MRKIALLLFLLFAASALSQNKKLTLEKIESYTQKDTIKVEMMIDFCVNNVFSNDKKNLVVAQRALHLSKELNYVLGEIRALNCMGNYYYQQAIYDKAIAFYTVAIKIAEKNKDDKNIIIGKSNLASLYTRTNEIQKALQLFHEIDKRLIKTGYEFSQNRAAVLTNMGLAYSSVKQHTDAIRCHQKTLEICTKKNLVFGIALAESNIGDELIKSNRHTEALNHLILSKKESEKNGFDNFLGQIYKNLAEVHWQQKKQDSAVFYLNKSIAVSEKINDQNALLLANNLLHRYHANQNNYKMAYQTLLNFNSVNQNIFNKEKQNSIAEISTKYETEKKEAQIKALSQQKKIADLESQKQKSITIAITLFLLSLLIIGYLLFKRYKANQKNELLKVTLEETEKTLKAEKKAAESELKALKSQMNPHFIFNALNSIQEQFMFGDKLLANEQMGNFTTLTRQILTVSGKKQISLATEVDILTKYLELEKMRFDSDFTYHIKIAENIDDEYTELPPMLIQPFVENSIKHGLLHKKGLKELHLTFTLNDDETFLICTIQDNGIGRAQSKAIQQKNKHNSFSTSAIAQRLELLYDGANMENLLQYKDLADENGNPTGTVAILQIYL
ncbi:MAG: hypothetical protein C0525_06820 [Flavobacterium sp.]|uniref:tetratricopeptide repeat-containing sensor histidine kinase n=1 Tax=Flavobacterium sp. TaxID=239 RepID=UPI0025BFB76C|nr:histidine kinase [Flavobacterium sp.]MBA4134421.1 hypothetical protein [Flavobacterium sp.]